MSRIQFKSLGVSGGGGGTTTVSGTTNEINVNSSGSNYQVGINNVVLNDISNNTSNISTNANDITTNSNDIQTNLNDITTNASNITTNSNDIVTNNNYISAISSVLYVTWGGVTKPYFNFTNGSDVIIPYDTVSVNTNIQGVSQFTYNNVSPTSSTFQVSSNGIYEISINAHFFDQFGDLDIFAGIFNNSTNTIVTGLIDQKDVTGNTDSNWYGSNITPLVTGVNYDIRMNFSGGSGQNPFPSNTSSILNSLCIKRIG